MVRVCWNLKIDYGEPPRRSFIKHFEDDSYQRDGGMSKGNTSDLLLQFLLYLLCMILCFLISFLCQLSIFNALHLHPLLLAGYVLTFEHVGSFSNSVGCSLWFVSITLSKKHWNNVLRYCYSRNMFPFPWFNFSWLKSNERYISLLFSEEFNVNLLILVKH